MAGTTIRNVVLEDADGVSLLVTGLGYPTGREEMAERLARLLSDPSYSAFVAERAGSLLGLAGGRIGQYFEKSGSYAQLVVMVVAANAQRTGVGTALLNAVEHWAVEKGAREIIVNSGNHRDEAHRFYERRGFRGTGVRFQKSLIDPLHRLQSTPGGAIMRPSPLNPSGSRELHVKARKQQADSFWPLLLDLLWARALVWVASAGKDGVDLTPEAHAFFFDRYHRLAQYHRARGRLEKARRIQAKAEKHYRAGGIDGPPFAAAMAMPQPRRFIQTDAVSRTRLDGPDDAA